MPVYQYLGFRGGWLNGFKRGSFSWKDSYGKIDSIGVAVHVDEKGIKKNFMLLFYTQINKGTAEGENLLYKVNMTTTPCNFNVMRYWFICRFCGRRVGKLYLPSGGKYFGCRHCYDLTYRSCQEHSKKLDFFMRNPDLFAAI